MSTPTGAVLREGEHLIRSDLVEYWGAIEGVWWPQPAPARHHTPAIPRLSTMTVTDQRLIFERAIERWRGRVTTWLMYVPLVNAAMLLLLGPPPLAETESFELANVESLHGWHPELSGPPMLQIGRDGWYFRLRSSPTRIARLDARREHFHIVQATWEAARSRAASHDSQL